MPAGWRAHAAAADIAGLLRLGGSELPDAGAETAGAAAVSPGRRHVPAAVETCAAALAPGAPTAAAVFSVGLLRACAWAQHERADTPLELGALLQPLLFAPDLTAVAAMPAAGGSAAVNALATAEARVAAWNEDAAPLLQLLLAGWEALPEAAFSLSAALPGAAEVMAGRGCAAAEGGSAPQAMAAVKATVKAFAKAAASDAAPDGQVPAAGSSAGEARKAKRKKLPASRLMLPLRWALTGQSVGPALGDVVGLLGREACLARLRAALQAAA